MLIHHHKTNKGEARWLTHTRGYLPGLITEVQCLRKRSPDTTWLFTHSLTGEERKSSIGCVAKSELNISANSWKHRLRKGWADHNYFDRSCIWLEDCIHRFKIDTQFIFASAEYLKHRSEGRCWPRKLDIMEKISSSWEPARWKTQERHPEVITWARKLMWTSRRSRATRLLHVHAWDVLVKKLRKEYISTEGDVGNEDDSYMHDLHGGWNIIC